MDLKALCFDAPGRGARRHRGAAARARRDVARARRGAARARHRARRRRRPLGRRVRRARLGRSSISVRDAIALVRERGLAMAEAAQASIPARWPRSSASPTRRSRALCHKITTCGRRTTTAPASSSSPARRSRSTRRATRRARRRAARDQAARVRRVPLAARRARRRASAPRGREGAPRRGPRGVHVDGDREARGRTARTASCSSTS